MNKFLDKVKFIQVPLDLFNARSKTFVAWCSHDDVVYKFKHQYVPSSVLVKLHFLAELSEWEMKILKNRDLDWLGPMIDTKRSVVDLGNIRWEKRV